MTAANTTDLQTRLAQALAGQYTVERSLGQGGMGTVFLGRDETLDRPVAIKVISPGVNTSEEIRQRFIQEARTVARLRHPNIVAVFAAGDAGGLLYFVMEFVPGESLRDRMNRQGKFTADDATPILRDLALALDYAHAAGIVHRDVKPENVLLDGETGRAMLMDFGVARALANDGRITGTGFVLGSPRYMSPEQASGDDKLDGRSDLYSIGLIAYEMFTGAPAVDAPTAASVLVKHLTERPTPLGEVVPDLPEDVASSVDRLLEKSPDARFQRGAAFAAALVGESFDDRTPSGHARAPVSRRPSRRQKRRNILLGGAAALVVAAIGGVWASRRGADVNDKSWFVAPFEVTGPDAASVDWLREGSVNMLTLSLSQWQDLHVAEYERTLDLLRSNGLDNARRVGLDQAQRIARDIGAGRIVMGQVTATTDSVVVTASLYDASGARLETARYAEVKGRDPRPLFDRISADLAVGIAGVANVPTDLSKQTTWSLGAYRDYIEGLRHLNAWRTRAADSAFDRAIAQDTTFALAYYKKALARGWISPFDSARRDASARAVRYAERLPARMQDLVRAHDDFTKAFFPAATDSTNGQALYFAARNRLKGLLATDSTDAEAWYLLADADFHMVGGTPAGRNADTASFYLNESMHGFQRTIALDPSFHLAFQHLVQLYAQAAQGVFNIVLRGDSILPATRVGNPQQVIALRNAARLKSREAAEGWMQSDPDAFEARRDLANAYVAMRHPDSAITVLQSALQRPTTAAPMFEWQIPLIKARGYAESGSARKDMGSAGVEIKAVMKRQGVDGVRRLSLNDRFQSLFGAMTVGGITGMPSLLDDASAMLAQTDPEMPGPGRQKSKDVATWLSNGMKAGMGMPVTSQMRSQLVEGVRNVDGTAQAAQFFAIPYLAYLATGDTVFSSAAQRWSRQNPQTTGLPEISALMALRRGDTTEAERIARDFPSTDSLRRATVLGMNGMRLIARARVMEGLGDYRRAVEIYETIDPSRFGLGGTPEIGWPAYVRSFLERGRLYEQLGEKTRAVESFERFLALWKDAEAPLQPQLREARDAINRIKESNTVPMKGAARRG